MKQIVSYIKILWCILLLPVETHAAGHDTVVNQDISYKTGLAKEVYIVWAVGEWETPPGDLLPEGSYIKDKLAYTKMQPADGSFKVTLPVRKNTYVQYLFWLSKDDKNNPSDIWDTNFGKNYSLFVKDRNEPRTITSIIQQDNVHYFSLFEYTWIFFFCAVVVLAVSLFISYRKKIPLYNIYLVCGYLVATLVVMAITRVQMNGLSGTPQLLFGAVFYDLVFLAVAGITGLYIVDRLKNNNGKKIAITIFFILFALFTIISLCNIEIVKQIGNPLNYQWLYYSDFLQSTDAKNALAKNLTPGFITDVILMVLAMAGFSFGLALLFRYISNRPRLKWTALLLLIGVTASSAIQKKFSTYDTAKTVNPVVAFASSWIDSRSAPSLFTMDVPAEKKHYIENYFRQDTPGHIIPAIRHIVILVLESTPAEYVEPYNPALHLTPNIARWSASGRIFTGVYAHIPSTPNSLFSLISGMYPPIGYKSIVYEQPTFPTRSLVKNLSADKWISSAFFSADLNYNNMGAYLSHQGLEVSRDMKNISCDKKGFVMDDAYMDGIDDACLVKDLYQWLMNNRNKKTFSIAWTSQTHHPYCVNEPEQTFVTGNPDLNRYLNALHHIDESFGALMADLQKEKLTDSTFIVLIGDHGEAFGRHNNFTHASAIFEENVHVPCIFINPLLFKGERDSSIAGLVDIPATINSLAGLTHPAEWQGHDLLGQKDRDRVFFFSPYSNLLFGTRHGNWKFIFDATDNSFRLYDLKADPLEQSDLSEKYPDVVGEEYEYIAAWVQYQDDKMSTLKSLPVSVK